MFGFHKNLLIVSDLKVDKLRQEAFAAGGKKKNKKKNKNSNSCSDGQHEMSQTPTAAVAASLPNSQQFKEWKESDTKVGLLLYFVNPLNYVPPPCVATHENDTRLFMKYGYKGVSPS